MSTTYHPGLEGVVGGETAISTLEGGLAYRGYPIEQLTERCAFEEVAHLLLLGDLPNIQQLREFRETLRAEASIPPVLAELLTNIPADVPAMDVLRTAVSVLAHFDADADDNSTAANQRKAIRLLAKIPVVIAARTRMKQKLSVVASDPSFSFAANFLWMLRGESPSLRETRALDVSLIAYAEHEFNASTFSARCVVSTLSDLHSGITAAIGALKGPLHGGANEKALDVLESVHSVEEAQTWVEAALARKVRIMGFGHRVYKDGDPRAVLLKKLTAEVAAERGHNELEAIADAIETTVRNAKKLPPNVDWPCARLYTYLGLPRDVFTPLFVMARTAGWSAHVIEQLANNRIIRPDAIYTGPATRNVLPIGER
ncbi:2-methylcitrate synthase/citrate synthase II [Pirellula staleyi DSM 6068]|uniref:Citrate synthase n=1 Tax=Pirellula staleyi (strain ATCC 27377 / DSM 6068 / ICPB 4128) TaxID=530564 RepID=D2QWL9_PIRSD|nr:citrate/2-methylcitrate synthase [Pirellula staleyi]ADB17822.1 2-methylcitrate synthase/citrate synthase II [Pirellula staleyi DSM 6068]